MNWLQRGQSPKDDRGRGRPTRRLSMVMRLLPCYFRQKGKTAPAHSPGAVFSRRLATLELRLPLFDISGNAFFGVFALEEELLQLSLNRQRLGEGDFRP